MPESETARAVAEEGRPEAPNHLSLAAAYVAQGDEGAACLALARHLEENPDHRKGRFYYAEVLRRLGKNAEAQAQFERSIADLQQDKKPACGQMVHCHGRLMDLAERQGDEYQAHLHRGIGLYWLAQERLNAPTGTAELAPEGLLCKAAAELSLAQALRPGEARPHWYLYSVWRGLAQSQLAQACLRDALDAAPFTFLTAAELSSLQMAHAASALFRPRN